MSTALHTPLPGLADPVFDSQSIFRTVLQALSRPGRIYRMPVDLPAPEGLAGAGICLCLLDRDTSLWLDAPLRTPAIESFLRFHTGCTITGDPETAGFAIMASLPDRAEIARFNAGTPEYPDRSTTIIVQTEGLRDDRGARLSGPGIEREHRLDVAGAAPAFWAAVRASNAQFPLGVDFLFVAGDRLAGLPRSILVEG
ncbi:MAG: phosphonate C-P lyase system protein PhnH [Alphaproteobacteria bacterium]